MIWHAKVRPSHVVEMPNGPRRHRFVKLLHAEFSYGEVVKGRLAKHSHLNRQMLSRKQATETCGPHLNVGVNYTRMFVVRPVLVALIPALLHAFGQRDYGGTALFPSHLQMCFIGMVKDPPSQSIWFVAHLPEGVSCRRKRSLCGDELAPRGESLQHLLVIGA